MLDLIVEIAAFILVLFFLVPFLFYSYWLYRIVHRGPTQRLHTDHRTL